jgi:hypothetical protein
VVGFAASLASFADRRFFAWQERAELERALGHVASLVAWDLHHAEEIETTGDSVLGIRLTNGDRVEYRTSAGRIWRNGTAIGSADGPTFTMKASLSLGDDSNRRHMKVVLIEMIGQTSKHQQLVSFKISLARSSLVDFRYAPKGERKR